MNNIEEESKESMYERTNHGAVDESSSEQQIRESADYTVIMAENWNPSTSGTGSYGRQAGRQTKNLKFERFSKTCNSTPGAFSGVLNRFLALLRLYQCSYGQFLGRVLFQGCLFGRVFYRK